VKVRNVIPGEDDPGVKAPAETQQPAARLGTREERKRTQIGRALVKVSFRRGPRREGEGDDTVMLDLDVLPKQGDDIYWDDEGYEVRSVKWFLNDPDEPEINPSVEIILRPHRVRV
jgi:hypothetical protein